MATEAGADTDPNRSPAAERENRIRQISGVHLNLYQRPAIPGSELLWQAPGI